VADAVIERIEFDALLEMLPDDVHREILKRHLDGSTVKEIAAILGVARDTVERKRKNIQRIYENSKAELPGIR
jgi:DNA-directed RNA polymerase specialized sigma24 family protein